MNFTESFEQFSSRVGTMDMALYAGVGLVIWVLFKDKLSPVQAMLSNLINQFRSKVGNPSVVPVVVPVVSKNTATDSSEDVFFKLVVSWKQTRDLAVQSGCDEAVKVADQMFPFLSPNVCKNSKDNV